MSANELEIKVPRQILKAIAEWKMPEFPDDDDWVMAKDIEDKMAKAFYANNQMVRGDAVRISFQNRRCVDLVRNQIEWIIKQRYDRNIKTALEEFDQVLGEYYRSSTPRDKAKSQFLKARRSAEQIVTVAVRDCSEVLKSYIKELPKDWSPKIICDWGKSRRTSGGGYDPTVGRGIYGKYGGISIAMSTIINREGKSASSAFREIKNLNDHPIMGGFESSKWSLILVATVCQTTARAAQQYFYHEILQNPDFNSVNGPGFQRLYALTRQEVCNPLLKKNNVKIGA